MHHLRFNIASALGAIPFLAVGFAALREADELWDSWLFSLTVGLLLVAALLATHRTGAARAFWIGFALFGWGYMGLSLTRGGEPRLITTKALARLQRSNLFGMHARQVRFTLEPDRLRAYGVSSEDIMKALTPSGFVNSPELLVTRTWLSKEYQLFHIGTFNNPEFVENIILKANPDGEIVRLKDVAGIAMWSSVYAPRVGEGTDENFVHVGHTLFALLAGWLGGVLSRVLSLPRPVTRTSTAEK